MEPGKPFWALGCWFPTCLGGAGGYPGAERRPAHLVPAGDAQVVAQHGLQPRDAVQVGRHGGVEEQQRGVAPRNGFLDLN